LLISTLIIGIISPLYRFYIKIMGIFI